MSAQAAASPSTPHMPNTLQSARSGRRESKPRRRESKPRPRDTVNTWRAIAGLTRGGPLFRAKPAPCCPTSRIGVLFHGGRSNRGGAVPSRLLEVPESGGYLEAVHHGCVALDHKRVPLPVAVD